MQQKCEVKNLRMEIVDKMLEMFKFEFVGEDAGMRQRELLKKFPLDSLQTFGTGDYVAEWWRAPIEVKCGHSHVRKRQVPPRP